MRGQKKKHKPWGGDVLSGDALVARRTLAGAVFDVGAPPVSPLAGGALDAILERTAGSAGSIMCESGGEEMGGGGFELIDHTYHGHFSRVARLTLGVFLVGLEAWDGEREEVVHAEKTPRSRSKNKPYKKTPLIAAVSHRAGRRSSWCRGHWSALGR